jgi:hypothetical protein
MLDERRLILTFLAVQCFTGCAHNNPAPVPPFQAPTYDSRLLVPCPNTYSTLPANPNFDDVMNAHDADIAQSEVCRCRYNALIQTVSPKTEVPSCPVAAQVPPGVAQ